MSESFVIQRTATRGRVVVLLLQGRLDAKAATALRQSGAQVAAEGRNLVLNLSGVTFMGSSGLGAILALSEEFREQAGEVRIADLSEAAKAVIRLIPLDQVVGIDADEESAIQHLAA